MSLTEPRKGFWLSPVDLITLIFTAWILLYMALGYGRVQDFGLHFPVYLSIFVGVLFTAWLQRLWIDREGKMVQLFRFLRGLYPVLLFGYFYTSNVAFNRVLIPDWQDPFFYRIDQAVFGYYPSLEWGKRYAHRAVSELFHGAYFCYYPMIAGLPVYLWFKNRKAFKELIFVLTFSFYVFYFIYSLLPTVGGRYFPEALELTKTYRGGLFTHIMVFIYNHSQHWGGAFPSSHVGITIVLTVAGLRYTKYMGYVFVIISFFLALATTYCHYHWFIDAIAGVFVGIILYYLGIWVCKKLNYLEHQIQ